MISTRKLALGVAGVVAAGVLGTAGVAAATATTDSAPARIAAPAPSGTAAPSAEKKRERPGRELRARGLHGEWVVKGKDGKPVTLVSVRGEVTAVGPTSVTVKAEDGFTATFTVTADTRVRGADVDAISDVRVGATGAVVGTKNGTTLTARAVLVRK
jgi:hypothetical protein